MQRRVRQPKAPARGRGDLAVVAIAFVVRAVTAVQIAALPLSRDPHFDALEYLGWARRVAAGDFTWPAFPPHGPGYPYFLGALLAMFGGSLVAVAIVQALVGAWTCWFVARTTTAMFGPRAGLFAGLILALYAPLIWIDVSIAAEGLLIFTMALALWSIATERHPAITGAILGVATIIRPTALILLPLALLPGVRFILRGSDASTGTSWPRRINLTPLIVALAVIAPITIANWRASHAFIPVQSFGAMNVYLGNAPLRDGLASARPGADWDRIEPEAARRGADEEQYFARKTRQEIAQHPLAYAALLGKKFVRTFQNDELRDTHSFYFFLGFAPLLWLVPFAILFGLAAGGASVADWRARGTQLAAGYVALTALTSIALVVGARYRMPMVVGLAPFAGLAIDRIRERKVIVVAIVAAALTLVWRDARTHNLAEEWALTSESLTQERNATEAESAARKAVAIDGESALAHDALAAALAGQGRAGDAIAEERRATALNPDFAIAHFHLGQLHEHGNDWNAAADDYRRAIAANPRDPRALHALAQVEVRRGNIEGALDATAKLAAQHEDADTLFDLARLQGAVGKAGEGLASARRAMALREPTADEWLLVATLATDAKDFAAAQQAIDRAQAAGAPAPPIMFNTALLFFREGRLDESAQLLDELLARMPDLEQARQLRAAVEKARLSRGASPAATDPAGSAAAPAPPSSAPR